MREVQWKGLRSRYCCTVRTVLYEQSLDYGRNHAEGGRSRGTKDCFGLGVTAFESTSQTRVLALRSCVS